MIKRLNRTEPNRTEPYRTNPYAAVFQLSGLAEVIVDSGKKATTIKCFKPNRTEPNRMES